MTDGTIRMSITVVEDVEVHARALVDRAEADVDHRWQAEARRRDDRAQRDEERAKRAVELDLVLKKPTAAHTCRR